MGSRHTKTTSCILFLLYFSALLYLCFADIHTTKDFIPSLLGIPMDKYAHFCMFFPFPILGVMAFNRKNFWRTLTFVIIASIIAAATIEFLQSVLTESRTSDPYDFVANMAGITSASILTALYGLFFKGNIK